MPIDVSLQMKMKIKQQHRVSKERTTTVQLTDI